MQKQIENNETIDNNKYTHIQTRNTDNICGYKVNENI